MSGEELTVQIYALYNPENRRVFYIGATQKGLTKRLKEHTNHAKGDRLLTKNKKNLLLLDLHDRGIKPEIILLDIVSYMEVDFWEQFYMQYFKSLGFNLLNIRHSYYRKAYWRKDIAKRLYKGTWRIYEQYWKEKSVVGTIDAFTADEAIEDYICQKYADDATFVSIEGNLENIRKHCRKIYKAELLDTYVGRNEVYKKCS